MTFTAADEGFMRRAIAKARQGVAAGQSPFGACIVRGDTVVACEHNLVWATTDITAHAEVTAIRAACKALATIDLSGCTIYSTCEPCPMCFGACHWAGVDRLVFGAGIPDAERIGFGELQIAAARLRELGASPMEVVGGCLRAENVAVMEEWWRRPDRQVY